MLKMFGKKETIVPQLFPGAEFLLTDALANYYLHSGRSLQELREKLSMDSLEPLEDPLRAELATGKFTVLVCWAILCASMVVACGIMLLGLPMFSLLLHKLSRGLCVRAHVHACARACVRVCGTVYFALYHVLECMLQFRSPPRRVQRPVSYISMLADTEGNDPHVPQLFINIHGILLFRVGRYV